MPVTETTDRIENRERMTPLMLVDPQNTDVKELLENALAGYQMV